MKIKQDFKVMNIMDDYILVPLGDQMELFNGTVVLNETSAFLLDNLKTDKTIADLVQLLTEEFDVGKDVARQDVEMFVEKMRAAGIIDE